MYLFYFNFPKMCTSSAIEKTGFMIYFSCNGKKIDIFCLILLKNTIFINKSKNLLKQEINNTARGKTHSQLYALFRLHTYISGFAFDAP